jgi:hypothetical protein
VLHISPNLILPKPIIKLIIKFFDERRELISESLFQSIFEFSSVWSTNKSKNELILSFFDACLPFKTDHLLFNFFNSFEEQSEKKRILKNEIEFDEMKKLKK